MHLISIPDINHKYRAKFRLMNFVRIFRIVVKSITLLTIACFEGVWAFAFLSLSVRILGDITGFSMQESTFLGWGFAFIIIGILMAIYSHHLYATVLVTMGLTSFVWIGIMRPSAIEDFLYFISL